MGYKGVDCTVIAVPASATKSPSIRGVLEPGKLCVLHPPVSFIEDMVRCVSVIDHGGSPNTCVWHFCYSRHRNASVEVGH